MIVSFSMTNFRSFAEEETFNLVSSNRVTGHHEGHLVSIPGSDEKVLRTAVVYGANGAGKSNLFKALTYLRTIAMDVRKKSSGTGRETFRFAEDVERPTSLDLLFIANDKLYRYGVCLDDQKVLEEWLIRVDGGKEKELYERVTDSQGKVKIEAKGFKTAGEKIKALATIGGPQNQTFLSTIRATLEASDYTDDISAVIQWFDDTLTLIRPDAKYVKLGHLLADDPDFLQFASDFLKSSSTGIDHLTPIKKEISEEQLRSLLPEEILEQVNNEMTEDGVAVVGLGEGKEVVVERVGENHFYLLNIQAAHRSQAGGEIPLDLSEESDGTRRLLHLIPALHHLRTTGGVYVIDEIDRSMHPMLTWKFLEFFLKCCEGEQRQIIVTTHESNLLDLDLLRRDEIWFAEKDKTGASKIYSLADFKVRKDLEIRKHYLQGRFGAVPFLGNLDRLAMEEEAANQ